MDFSSRRRLIARFAMLGAPASATRQRRDQAGASGEALDLALQSEPWSK